MKDLFILGSSYLIPNNKEWSSNLEGYALHFSNYGDWNEFLTERSEVQDALLIIFLDDLFSGSSYSLDTLEETLSPLLMLLEKSLQTSNLPVIVGLSAGHNFDVIRYAKGKHYLQKAFNYMFGKLELLANKYEHLYRLDLQEAFGEIGYSRTFDYRNWNFAHCRLSTLGISVIAKNANKIFYRHYGPASKVLVLDCDNTIWGGVIGEDKLGGIVLGEDGIGQAFVEFQTAVKELINQGVLVVLSSKNNEKEVWEVFEHHNSMVLTKDDIVAWRVNWNEKSKSIKEMAAELDLSLNSFVFWDDNPVERDKMKIMAPEVITVNAPVEVYKWPMLLKTLFDFAKFNTTSDDAKKTTQYHQRAKFVQDRNSISDEESYLKSIKLAPVAHSFDESNIQRASQLCFKTNQFNLRSVRHTVQDLVEMSEANNDLCFLVSLEDLYGSHGLVGLVCMKKLDDRTAFLDTFLMSCRVLGRHLESWMLRQALTRCKNLQIKNLIGGFVPSERNLVASSFFADNHFLSLAQGLDVDQLQLPVSNKKNEILYTIATNIKKLPFEDIYA